MAKGKRIDTLRLTHEGVTVEVPLIMHRNGGEILFQAEIREHDIDVRDTDATRLRETVDKQFRERLQIDWQPFLRVCFGGSRDNLIDSGEIRDSFHKNARARMKIEIERLWIGTAPDGQKMHCVNYGEVSTRHGNVRKGLPDTGKVDSHFWHSSYDGDGVAALIPDTEENRIALQSIIDDMEKLSNRLREVFSQEQIETTLALTGSNKLLTS